MVVLKRQAAAAATAAASRMQSQGHSGTGTPGEVKRDPDHPMQDESDTKPNGNEEGNATQQAAQNAIPVRVFHHSSRGQN